MSKLSRQFFLLYILAAVLPLLIGGLWYLFSTNLFASHNFSKIIGFKVETLEASYRDYVEETASQISTMASTVEKNELTLNQYKSLFQAESIEKELGQQDCPEPTLLVRNEHPLVCFPISLNSQTFTVYKELPFNRLFKDQGIQGPMIIQVFALEDNNKKLIFESTDEGFLKATKIFLSKLGGGYNSDAHENFPKSFGPKNRFKYFKNGLYIDTKRSVEAILKNSQGESVGLIKASGLFSKKLIVPINFGPINTFFMIFPFAIPLYIQSGIILIISLIVSLTIGWYFKQHFVKPLQHLSLAAQHVKQGDFSARVTVHSKQSDIQGTVNNFNEMLETLSEQKQMRQNFVTNLAHDLKTPLLAEQRSLNLIHEEPVDDEVKKLIVGLKENNQHLLSMVEQLLQTYQFDHQQMTLNRTSINLHSIIENAVLQLESLAQKKKIELINELSTTRLRIEGDGNLLKRLFMNLLANAIDNIPENSMVTITGEQKENTVEIHIQDNGSGIAPEDLPHLFNRFYMGQSDERQIGFGLGLYICKQIVQGHQGDINVDSRLGEYTDFCITLPTSERDPLNG